MTITPEVLASIVGIVAAMLLEWFPRLNTWFKKRNAGQKQGLILALMVLVGAGIYALSCTDLIVYVSCDKAGVVQLGTIIFVGWFSSQATHYGTNQIGKRATA